LDVWRNTTCNQCVLLGQTTDGCELENWDYETFQFGFMFSLETWRTQHNSNRDMQVDANTVAVIKIKNSSNVLYPHLTIRGFNTPACQGCSPENGGDVDWAWSIDGEDTSKCSNCDASRRVWFFNMHVWASQAEVQQKDIVLNFEFSMGDKLYVS